MNSAAALWRLAIGGVVFASIHAPNLRAGIIRFVVAERPGQVVHGDSYILPLTEPDDIAHARALLTVEPGTLASIAVAHVAAGPDGVNRDWLAPGRPEWSWHVTGFEGFFDVTAEVLDGWPTFVEQDVPGWIANTGGQIGFWDYTVVAELPVPEPQTITILACAIVVLATAYRHVETRRPPTCASAPANRAQKKALGSAEGLRCTALRSELNDATELAPVSIGVARQRAFDAIPSVTRGLTSTVPS